MSSAGVLTIIRKAIPSEFPLLSQIHHPTFSPDPAVSLLWRHTSPSSIQQWYWLDGALPTVQDGSGTVLVAQERGSEEIVGFAWYLTMSSLNPPTAPTHDSFPEGYNVEESAKMRGPRMEWQNSLLAKYGTYIYLDSLAVLPSHQGKGYGSKLMSAVLEDANRRRLNVALCSTSGKNGFYEKFGFKELQKPVLLDDGKVEGFNSMLLEAFPAKQWDTEFRWHPSFI